MVSRQQTEQAIAGLPANSPGTTIGEQCGRRLGLDPAQTANLDDWDAMVDSNIRGVMYCTRLLLPGMLERGRGHIVNLGSVEGEFPYPGGNVYGAAKAFVHQFSQNLRADFVGRPSALPISSPVSAVAPNSQKCASKEIRQRQPPSMKARSR